MANDKEEKVVEAKAEATEEKKEQKNVTFSLGTLSVFLSLIALGLWFLIGMIAKFGVNFGVARVIFFILEFGIGVFAGVLAWINAKQKFTLPLAFAAFVVLIISCGLW